LALCLVVPASKLALKRGTEGDSRKAEWPPAAPSGARIAKAADAAAGA